jgi:hypothetical protein
MVKTKKEIHLLFYKDIIIVFFFVIFITMSFSKEINIIIFRIALKTI